MKIRTYIRIAKRARDYKVEASLKPSYAPIERYPTVAFGIDLNLPDDIFDKHKEVIAELTVPSASIKADIKIPTKAEIVMDKLKGATKP